MKTLLCAIASAALWADEPYYNSLFDALPPRSPKDYMPLYIKPELLEKLLKEQQKRPAPIEEPHRRKARTWYV